MLSDGIVYLIPFINYLQRETIVHLSVDQLLVKLCGLVCKCFCYKHISNQYALYSLVFTKHIFNYCANPLKLSGKAPPPTRLPSVRCQLAMCPYSVVWAANYSQASILTHLVLMCFNILRSAAVILPGSQDLQ